MTGVLIYSSFISNRLKYTLDFIFNDYLKIGYTVTHDKTEFLENQGCNINYSDEVISIGIQIIPSQLLMNENIEHFAVQVSEIDGKKVLFPNDTGFPFDVFSSVFYLLSRYEEYVEFPEGSFRFLVEQSIAKQNNFLKEPVVHIWIEWLAKELKDQYVSLEIKYPDYQFILTIDVDNAYAYLHKGFLRTVGGLLKSLLTLRLDDYFQRWITLLGMQKDKYDSYDYIQKVLDENGISPVWFFLLGNYNKYDKNVNYLNAELQKLIVVLNNKYSVGIHPSFGSNEKEDQLEREVKRLESIIGNKVIASRQHFLRMKLPETYQKLNKRGINSDYTMGFVEESGFRAGVAMPFKFFDLSRNEVTDLIIYPFQVMDTTLRRYKHLSVDESKEEIKAMVDKTFQYHGTYVCLWHNESLGSDSFWKDWRSVFEYTIEYGKKYEIKVPSI